jgi:hypothetical protein
MREVRVSYTKRCTIFHQVNLLLYIPHESSTLTFVWHPTELSTSARPDPDARILIPLPTLSTLVVYRLPVTNLDCRNSAFCVHSHEVSTPQFLGPLTTSQSWALLTCIACPLSSAAPSRLILDPAFQLPESQKNTCMVEEGPINERIRTCHIKCDCRKNCLWSTHPSKWSSPGPSWSIWVWPCRTSREISWVSRLLGTWTDKMREWVASWKRDLLNN